MKITKYPQSCVMLETKGKKILVDPGTLCFKEEYIDEWAKADYILITHKHGDHCHAEIIKNFDAEIFSTEEVQKAYPQLAINIVEADLDILELKGIEIEVVAAVHGYIPLFKGGKEVYENVGYIIDDGDKKVYITSDTICFPNNYKADIICGCVSGHVCMTEWELSLFAKEAGAELVIPVHMDAPMHPVDIEKVKKTFEEFGVKYKILANGETTEI
ncbi:MAG TPA: hypothetical protein DEP72_04215 [Clostridiales bacterium]|nr:MAG: hypothetical protein A2Y18_04905 [Clostridiales bacterium GWD2_32_19]HCC07345.1 hypothetical protein [Clostridiales bacterium]